MQYRKSPDQPCKQTRARLPKQPWRFRCGRTIACIAAMATLALAAQPGQQSAPGMPVRPEMPPIQPMNNRLPDANDQMKMREQQSEKQNVEAANVERKRQIAEDSTKLLKLAADLKAEVDKTSKDTLSLNVIRKADEIERLAHDVKEKMKLTVGGT